MSNEIKKYLGKLNIVITPKMISNFLDVVTSWENKKDVPLVLHGQLLGVYSIYFTSSDRENLFHCMGVDSKELSDIIKTIPTVDTNRNVTSDPFNLLIIWLVHLSETQIKNKKLRDIFSLALLKYLHYKFLTGCTQKFLPHGAIEGTMIATVMDLSRKFDITRYGSWYNVIEARCVDILSGSAIHKKTLLTAEPDHDLLYMLSDIFTRMSAKIKLIAKAYYDHYSTGSSVKSTGSTMSDTEGEKILIEKSSTIQMVDSRLTRDLLNVNAWVNISAVNNISSQFPSISKNLIKLSLTEMSSLATVQAKTKKFDPYAVVDGDRVIVGMTQLVKQIVTTSAAIVANEGVVLSNTYLAWKTLRNAFSSSRTLDPDVLLIKASVAHFVDELGSVSREATKISLRMSIIMYVIYRFIILVR